MTFSLASIAEELMTRYAGLVGGIKGTEGLRGNTFGVAIPSQLRRPRAMGKILDTIMKIEQHDYYPMLIGNTKKTRPMEAVK